MTKRITIEVDADIDTIRDFIAGETGVRMSYIQVFNHLIFFYMKHANEPRSKWVPLPKAAKEQA